MHLTITLLLPKARNPSIHLDNLNYWGDRLHYLLMHLRRFQRRLLGPWQSFLGSDGRCRCEKYQERLPIVSSDNASIFTCTLQPHFRQCIVLAGLGIRNWIWHWLLENGFPLYSLRDWWGTTRNNISSRVVWCGSIMCRIWHNWLSGSICLYKLEFYGKN